MMSSGRPSVGLDGFLMAGRYVTLMRRNPSSLLGAVVFPIVFTVLFFTVFKQVMERIGIDYAQFLIPAVAIQAMFFTGMSSAVFSAQDAQGGMLTRVKSLPVSRTAPFVGLLCAEAIRALVSLAILLPLGMLLGFRFHAGTLSAVGFVAMAVLFAIVASAGYISLGLFLGNPETAQALVVIPYFPLLMLSNAFSPADRFPGWLQPFVNNQPVSQTADALRALSSEGLDAGQQVLEALAWLVPALIVFTALSAKAFGRTR